LNWTERILEFPVRAAAVDDFLRDLRARGTGDLNAVLTTLNESGLCRTAVRYWTENGWIQQAPNTPLYALTGPAFDRALTLSDFCGEIEIIDEEAAVSADARPEERKEDGDS
jgi:hypothetical protein